jgi:hypothetical protein
MGFKSFTALGLSLLVALFAIEATTSKKVKELEGPALYKCTWSPDVLTLEGWVGKVSIRRYHFTNRNGMKYTVKGGDYRECRALPRPPASNALKRARQEDTALRWFFAAAMFYWVILALSFSDEREDERVPWERKSHFQREWQKEEERRKAILRAREEDRLKREREKSQIAREERASRKAKRRAEHEARRAANKARKEANNG